MLFYAVGELFQDSAVNRAKRNICALLDVRPETATVVKGDSLETVSPENVNIDDVVEVKVGGRVPLDRRFAKRICIFQYCCTDRRKCSANNP